MTSISYFPVVNDEEQLMDLLSRAAWFLSFCPIDRIYVPISADQLKEVPWRVAPGMDDSIGEKFPALRSRIVWVVAKTESDLDVCMTEANIILRWKKDAVPGFVSAKKLAGWEKGKKVWQVDPVAVRMEGSFYIEVGLHLLKDRQSLIHENQAKFGQMGKRLGKFKRAYLMATGPSVSRYKLFDYTDSLSIICNSVILDEELMSTVRPQILVFADPIFHFGPSQYAAAFRAKLRESAEAHDFMICIPFKYYGIFISAVPELRDRTIAVPFVKDRPFNFDLSQNFEVRTTANILTLLMTPLASSFTDKICYLGCDGRPLKDNNYFWSHNQNTQFNDKMANIRAVHPGFFAIDYNDYYLEHCGTLEAQFQAGEDAGKRFYSLGFSHIPALKQRIDVGCRKGRGNNGPVAFRALLIDPDAKSWSGHYMAYNEKLCFQLGRLGADVRVVCRKDLSPEILSTRPSYIPALTAHSWEVGNRAENEIFLRRFEEEMLKVIEHECSTVSPPAEVLLYMYCGSLEHAKVLAKLQEQYPFLLVNVNLFWLSFRINHDWIQNWKPFLEWLDSRDEAFVASVPTRELQSELAELTGCVLPVAPHPSTAITDENYHGLEARVSEGAEKEELRVLFPSAPRPEKGYLLSVECARLLGGSLGLRSVIRHSPTFSTPKPLTAKLQGMPANTTVIEGELSDEEFINLFSASDIVVLPYMPDAFAKRTSGLLIDAIYHRIPCVVIEGTWLAEVVRSYECGVIVQEASVPLIAEAVRSIADRHAYYRAKTHAAAVDYFSRNSWEKFGSFLLGLSSVEQSLITKASRPVRPIIGPYTREQNLHWDETNCIAQLFSTALTGSTMIDVGAHHGSALMPFLNMGWNISAFEPDEKNRQKLLERLAKHARANLVKLDTHAVSNESRSGLSFYRSEESTGISGLSAFHPSHKAEQTVDTVTLTEVLAGESISAVDFLKIDTEGHDLFVLKGFPWDRFRPAVIECEFEDSKTVPLGYTFHDLASYLVEKGYTIYVSEWHPIIRYGIRHDWNRLVRYPCELADPKGWGNLLAFRDPIDEAVLVAAVQKVMKVGAAPAKKSSTAAPAPVAEKVVAPSTSPAVPSFGAVIVPPAYRVLPGPFKQLAPSLWRYQLSEQKNKRFWEAVFNRPILAGQAFIGGLTVESDHEMKVRVSLGRAGDAPYEGRQSTLPLSPGQVQKVVLEHPFSREHSSVKVQIEVLSFKGEAANLSIKEVFVHERTVTIPPAPVAPLRKPDPVAHVPLQAPAAKTLFAERLAVRMGRPIEGRNWSAPGKAEWISVRWAAAGQRATLALPVQRDREMLVVVACHPDGAKDRLDQLKVEIDGVVLPHTVYGDITPICIVVRMPARTEASHTPTELALVVPAAPESAPVNGKPLGLAVSAVSVLPTRPENTAKPELPGPRWSRRLMRLVDRRGKAKLPFPYSHFDGVTYLAENPDVAENVLAGRMPSALFHYQRYGLKEQRRLTLAITRPPNEGGLADMFDGRAYLESYPDVAAAVRSETIPSALEHYVRYGRSEGRKVGTSFDGSACRGTALDLVRLESGRELRATLHGVKQQLSQDLAMQIGQVGSRLAKMESVISSLARATDIEALRAELRKDLALCARTAELQTVRQDLTASLDALRHEAEKRAGHLAGEIRDRFSTAARATDLTRMEQATGQTMERLRARIGELERTEQQEKERLERLHGELETARVELKAQVLTLRQELEHGLGDRVRMAEFQRMEQWSLSRIEELHSELTDADRLASQRVERLQGDLDVIWQDLESGAVALRQDFTSALDRLRGDREAREGELAQEMREGLSRAARASELVRVEQLGKQNMEQLYDAVRAMKGELEAKAEAVQQELHGGLAERARIDDLERIERVGLDRLDRFKTELETVRNELNAKAVALRQELEEGLGERVRAEDLERMELFAGDRLDRFQAELETVRGELDAKAVVLRQKLEQGLGERVQAEDLERMELLTGNRLERLHADLETVRGELGVKVVALRQELEQGLKDRARHDELERVEQRAGDRWERLHAELAALASIREARESAIASQIEAVKAGFELAVTKVELSDVKHSSLQRDIERETDQVRTQVAGMDERLSSADASVRKLTEGLDQIQKQQTTDHSRLTHPNSYAFNVIGYQAFPRQLTMANAGRLAKHWGPLLGVTIPEKELFYLAHRICQIENACLGRLATSIDAILLRSLVARAAGSTPLEVLEIGTLFGLGLIAMHEAIAPFFERVHFTALDPLEGYYGKEHRDILTGVPISRAVFDENLRRAGIPGDRVTVIQHLSTDAIAMEAARKTRYGLLVIDGDHRYAGVKHDLEAYLDTVRPGGYVLVDDYGNPSWPDVKNYVDAEVLGRKDLELVGSDWHTAVFRVAGAH